MSKKLESIFKIINMKNINQGITTFNKAVQDFGDSMDSITKEMSSDIEKSNKESVAREQKNKENLDKIWGKKDWGAKFVKFLTRILVNFNHGQNNNHVGYVVTFVTIFLGMVTIYTNTGVLEIEMS